jgi:type IV pilus assembly protein PilV
MKPHFKNIHGQSGFSMIEVLVTLLILLLGLLGLAGLIRQSQNSEMESYQRVQALVLLRDMAERINANRGASASYVTGVASPLGAGSSEDCTSPTTTADIDRCQWDAMLKGAAETSGTSQVGAMLGGRGCITQPSAAASAPVSEYLVEVVWQGVSATAAPPTSVLCGKDAYGDDKNRRAVTTLIRIGAIE